MASQVGNGSELLEIDMYDGDICSEEESGVFVNSRTGTSFSDAFSGFQNWSATAIYGAAAVSECPNDTSSQTPSPQSAQQLPNGHGSASAEGDNTGGLSCSECPEDDYLRVARPSIVDCLLVELYDTYSSNRRSFDSLDSSTEASSSEAFLGRSNAGSSFLQELQEKHTRRHQMNYLAQKAPAELHAIVQEVKYRTGLQSAKLLRQLKRRDRLCHKLQKNYDIITACLQAVSQKRRVDTRLKFTIEPSLGKNGFQQWYDALKSVARLPTGVPKEWRKRVWLTLAEQYLHSISIDWEKTLRFAFNERSNPDDDSLGIQIVKDLHRTGCSSYSGQEGEQDRVVLKRVLLAYARWNKSVGYCQGFNVLAALILEVTQGNESEALKVMIYLIDKVLPESYFANNLRALSVDMAVFRDLLRLKLPRLSQHLHHLQKAANREAGGSYEPPLTNVFTMQWFLTMFATCLPQPAVLKIWDSVFFEGSEVLLRVALVIWERLGERIEYCQSADEFYSTMGRMTQEMLEHNLIEPTEMMQEVYSMAVFPFPQLAELREKYTYNITPFPTSVKANGSGGLGGWDSDDDVDMDDEDSVVTALGCLGPLGGLLTPELQRYQKHLKDQSNIGELSPGAVGAGGVAGSGRAEHQAAINSMMLERMSTDISALKKQYSRIKRRQQQQATQLYIRTDKCPATSILASQLHPSAPVVNHLLLGRKTKGGGPRGSRGSLTHAPAHGASPAPRPRAPTSPSPSSGPCQSGHAQAASPWRAHVRAHRRNVARARAQLGFGNSVDPEEEEDGAEPGRRDRRLSEGEERRREEEEEPPCTLPASPSQDPCVGAGQQVEQVEEVEQVEQVEQVEEGLASLELETRSGTPSPAETNPTAAPGPSPVPDPVLGSPPEPEPSPNPGLTPPPSSYRRTESDSTEPAFFEETGAMATPGPSPSSSSDTDTLLKAAPEPEPSIPALLPPPASHRRKESDSSVSGPPLLRRSPTTPDSPTPRLPSSPTTPTSPTTPDSPTPRLPSSPTTPTSPTTPVSPTTPTSPTTPASPTPRIPSSPSTPCLSPSPLSASTPTGAALNHPQQAVFSPFPSVKQPRKSAAARNLGLYGPTPRTPTVHFPQLSLNRSAGRTATRRR